MREEDSFWNLLKRFWADNVKSNYKKISIGIGTVLNIVLGYYMFLLCTIYPELSPIWIGIEAFVTVVLLSFFGTRKNGNGYEVPATKKVLKVLETNSIIRTAVARAVKKMDAEERKKFFIENLKNNKENINKKG